jgi:hypothetical protein
MGWRFPELHGRRDHLWISWLAFRRLAAGAFEMNEFWMGFLVGFLSAPLVIAFLLLIMAFWYIHKHGIPFAH